MGESYVSLSEMELPEECPFCGSKRFKVEGARKVLFEAVYVASDDGVIKEGEESRDVEWEVVYSVACDSCGEDLSELCGL